MASALEELLQHPGFQTFLNAVESPFSGFFQKKDRPVQTLPNGSTVVGTPNDMKLTVSGAVGGGEPQQTPQPQQISPMQAFQNFFAKPAAAQQSTPQPAALDDKALEEKIRAGYRKYSGGKEVPMEKHIPLMIEAAKKYPIFQQNPMLIPATSLVETSGGSNTNWKHLNNPLSWGARLQNEGVYNPKSEEESINDMITAVGGDPERGKGFDPETAKNRMATASYYDKFRKSNNLKDFTDTYDGGNEKYLPALQDAMKYFQ